MQRIFNHRYVRIIYNNMLKRTKTYLPSHEWITNDEIKKMGLAKSGHDELGELVYIDFSVEKGDIVEKDDELIILESVKATDSINSPDNFKIVDINENFDLELINEDPECETNSWLVKLKSIS
jgi:glycine cleavage system H lipoate-binding protein